MLQPRPPPLTPPHRGEGNRPCALRGPELNSLMAPIAQRLFSAALAGAEVGLGALGRLVFDGRKARALVRAVAERLALRAAAGAPPVGLARFHLDRQAPAPAHLRHLVHAHAPPPCVL